MNNIVDNIHQQACKAQEEHERRLARIVVDQWMHVAHKRLMMACCFQMVQYWHKLCSKNKWIRQKSYLATNYHIRKRLLKSFYAFHEGNKNKIRNQSIALAFHKQTLQKKTLQGLRIEHINFWQNYGNKLLKKEFCAIKQYYQMKKATKYMNDGAKLFYNKSLKKKTLNSFSKHREHLKLKQFQHQAALYHWKKYMMSRLLKRWKIIAIKIFDLKKKAIKSRIQVLKALLHRCIKNWYSITKSIITIRNDKIMQASQKCNKSYKKKMLQAWAKWYREKQSKKLNLEKGGNMHKCRISSIVTNAWHNYATEKGEKRALTSVAYSFKKRQTISNAIAIWKAYQAKKLKAGTTALKALTHLRKNLTRKSMVAWRPLHDKQVSKKHKREMALNIYKSRLQRWACERILAVGLMLQALRLQSNEKRLSTSSTTPYMKIAPYARKWWYIAQRRSNLRKTLLHQKNERSLKERQGEQRSKMKESFTHELVLRIGIDKDTLKIQHERPPSPQLEMTNIQGRPQPRKNMLLTPPFSPPSPIPTLKTTVQHRPIPRRPSFLSFQIS